LFGYSQGDPCPFHAAHGLPHDDTCRRIVDAYHLTSIDGDWYLIKM
jgi:hypothetical protein